MHAGAPQAGLYIVDGDHNYATVRGEVEAIFGSDDSVETLAVMGITPDVQPDLESVRTFSYDEKFFRKLFFMDDRLVGAIMIGPPMFLAEMRWSIMLRML